MRYYIRLKTTVVTTAAQFVSDGKWILEQWVEFSMMIINLDINMFFYWSPGPLIRTLNSCCMDIQFITQKLLKCHDLIHNLLLRYYLFIIFTTNTQAVDDEQYKGRFCKVFHRRIKNCVLEYYCLCVFLQCLNIGLNIVLDNAKHIKFCWNIFYIKCYS